MDLTKYTTDDVINFIESNTNKRVIQNPTEDNYWEITIEPNIITAIEKDKSIIFKNKIIDAFVFKVFKDGSAEGVYHGHIHYDYTEKWAEFSDSLQKDLM